MIGGHVARRLVPAAMGIPLFVGIVRWNSVLLVGTEIRTSVMVLASAALLVIAALWTSSGLDRLDRERQITEAKFRGLLESAPDPIVVINAQGNIAMVNGQTESIFGYRREELLGRPMEMLIPDRFFAAHGDHLRTFFLAPSLRAMGQRGGLVARRKDGSEFPAEISLGPFDSLEGTLVSCAVRDITDRLGLEESLRANERRLSLALAADGRMGPRYAQW
jgi:PAS domain S-box-containing protein